MQTVIHFCKSAPTIHIVGAAIMGLLSAVELAFAMRRRRLPVHIVVHEPSALGGGPWAATPRCQAWFHRHGVIYAQSQPLVSMKLQAATARLVELIPAAIRTLLALAIEPPSSQTAAACFDLLKIEARQVSHEVFSQWLPMIRLGWGKDCKIFMTADGTLDLGVAVRELRRLCRKLGIEFRRNGIDRIELQGNQAVALHTKENGTAALRQGDNVVLTCGTGIRPLLARSDLSIPGLRHFDCTMAAAPAGVPALLACLMGGPNIVPHVMPDGSSINVFANSRRVEVEPTGDEAALVIDPRAVADLRRDIAETFGIELPGAVMAWVGRKAEIVPEAQFRSQAQHVLRVGAIDNLWAALPGKLSQSAGTAGELVEYLLRDLDQGSMGSTSIPDTTSIWQRLPAATESVGQTNDEAPLPSAVTAVTQ